VGGVSTCLITGLSNNGFYKIGMIGGGFINYMISEKNNLQMELCYIEKGDRINPNPNKNNYNSYRLNMQYIEIPVLFAFKNSGNLFFESGLSYAALLGYSEKDQYGSLTNPYTFKDYDVGLNLGVRIPYKKGFSFNFRFFNSIIPVRKHASGAVYRLNRGQYNSVISFKILYQFANAKPKEA